MKIIPAIDIMDGKCVRLSQGDYDQKKVYHENPVDMAKSFEDAGLSFLHVVDLDGARKRKIMNWKSIQSICSSTQLQIDFGGGISTSSEIQQLIEYGVQQVNIGSIAIKKPEVINDWLEEFGSEKIILSADIHDQQVAFHGWTETSTVTISQFLLDHQKKGIRYVTCTDIQTDGMLSGPNLSLYKKLREEFSLLKIIASGGVSSINDIHELGSIGMHGVIIGKAIYEGKVSLKDLALINKYDTC